jgi:hypothetical protein
MARGKGQQVSGKRRADLAVPDSTHDAVEVDGADEHSHLAKQMAFVLGSW